jgi:D-methionine transport system permease protein
MAGAIGGEGLGDMAIRWGYYRFRMDVTIAAVIVILALVEIFQAAGTLISRSLLAKR